MPVMNLAHASLKAAQAERHLITGMRELSAWIDGGGAGLTWYEDDSCAYWSLLLEVEAPPPVDACLYFADFFVNARAALDYVAWHVYLLHNPGGQARVEFPIIKEGETWPPNKRGVPNASDDHAALFARAQDEGGDNMLVMLRDFSNSQKHRTLSIMSTGYQPEFEVQLPTGPTGSYPSVGTWTRVRSLETPGTWPILVTSMVDKDAQVVERDGSSIFGQVQPRVTIPLAVSDGENYLELHMMVAQLEIVERVIASFEAGDPNATAESRFKPPSDEALADDEMMIPALRYPRQ